MRLQVAVASLSAMASGTLYYQQPAASPATPVPVSNASVPSWMDRPPFASVDANVKQLPSIADYVIIGTGLAGLAATKTVLELSHDQRTEMPLSVVALDARGVASGATARNPGHIKTNPYHDFAALRRQLAGDADKARLALAFMRRQLDALKELGRDVPVGEVRDVETVDLFLHAGDFEAAKAMVGELKTYVPEIEVHIWSSDEARKRFTCNDVVVGAISYAAGAASPYRLVTGVWKVLMDKYPELVVRSNTLVESVAVAPNSPQHPYAVRTAQGSVIRARHVLHATNAYAPHLLPRLRTSLTGVRGSLTAQRPGASFPAAGSHGGRSWAAVENAGLQDVVAQRPDKSDGSPGDVIFGVGVGSVGDSSNSSSSSSRDFLGRCDSEGGGLFPRGDSDFLDTWDDSSQGDALPLDHARDTLRDVFANTNTNTNASDSDSDNSSSTTSEKMRREWTGIMGFTGDGLPFVGALDQNITERRVTSPGAGVGGREGSGEWIAAGFNGRGMAWAWLSGAAAGVMMTGQDGDALVKVSGRPGGRLDEWFPRELLALDEERLLRAKLGEAL